MLKFVNIFLLTLFFALPAYAQDTYTRYRLPDSEQVQIRGERHEAFNLGGYQELLRIDNDLRQLTLWHEIDEQRIAALTEASVQYTLALNEANLALESSQADRFRAYALWEEENRRRQELENAPDYSWIPWTLAGGFAISTIILGIIVGAQ